MRATELLILDALNIATCQYPATEEYRDFATTADGIWRTIEEDERIREEWGSLAEGWTRAKVGYALRRMHSHRWREPLVAYDPRSGRAGLWYFTDHGIKALSA